MYQEPERRTEWHASFGPFILWPAERLLERDGVPVRLGGRALDLLIALVDSAGETVSKKVLIARVWPNVLVEEGSLRFHMVAVRRALGDGEGGSRYIVNTTNKGYTFVAPVERRESSAAVSPVSSSRSGSLPAPTVNVIGRDEDVGQIVASLLQWRLVSIVGPGGIGKTTAAIACAHALSRQFNADAHFIDLSLISDANLVCASVANALGLHNRSDDPHALATHLAERSVLIVLDCCEHVIEGAAELVEILVRHCATLHILVTSREPLRAEGELVHRLQPLAFPPDGKGTTAAEALSYPAVKLFVDRAIANCSSFELKDGDAPLASQLCRELDGIALAIELAAGRVEALGLEAITCHFDASIRLMWHGRRTAVPRQQTLRATLDWSFHLLSDDEKRLLCRLAVFAGTFSLDAALEICCFDDDKSHAIESIAGLVSKSLITVDAGDVTLRYGMLETTRSYCWKKLGPDGEDRALSQRFALYFSNWAQRRDAYAEAEVDTGTKTTNPDQNNQTWVAAELANLRAALQWLFQSEESVTDAVQLAASFCGLLLQLSRVAECARWAQTALSRMPSTLLGTPLEMQLQDALGQSLMFSQGSSEAETAYRRGIEVAEQSGDARGTLHLLNGYVVLLHRDGRYTDALATARKTQSLLAGLSDFESHAIVDSLMGVALHLTGEVSEAMRHWERCFAQSAGASFDTTSKLGFDFHIRALCGLARSLWLRGHYARAVAVADETIDKARASGHVVTHCIALIWAGSVHVWAHHAERLDDIAQTLERVARQHSLTPYLSVARIMRGQWLIIGGRAAEGVELIRSAIDVLHQCRYEMVTSVAMSMLARGLSDMSLHAAALTTCDEVAALIQRSGDFLRMPELLCVRGYCLAAAGRTEEGERSYREAIALCRTQEVKSGEVHAAVALAQLRLRVGRRDDARLLLHPLLADAADDMSPDLLLARSLLG